MPLNNSNSTRVKDVIILDLPKINSENGNITAIENAQVIPFNTKRVYYLYDIPSGSERGGHAHIELRQLIVAASGSFLITLDDGFEKRQIILNRPNKGLLMPPGIWRELSDFSSGSICLVLASHVYNESDYIRDYEEFKKFKELK